MSGKACKWLTIILWNGNVYFSYSGEQAQKWQTVVAVAVNQQLNGVQIYTHHAFLDNLMEETNQFYYNAIHSYVE